MEPIEPIPMTAIAAAQQRIAAAVPRTPLVRLQDDGLPGEVYLKLENLQPIGSFKLRGATNAIANAHQQQLAAGVYTASAGNMAQGLAYAAREQGIPCRVVVPDHVPQSKAAAIERLGGEVIRVPFDRWWDVIVQHRYENLDGMFIHPVAHPDVIAGHGTIGLEILDDLPGVDTVIVPFGGGGLSCGIASAIKPQKPHVRMVASEVVTAAPLAASLHAGRPVEIDRTHSFVDGIGGRSVLSEMWPLVSSLLDASIVVSLEEIAAAIRLLIERNHVVAEGAGASSVAAARSVAANDRQIVCIISGGNIDPAQLATILGSGLP